MMIAAAGHFVHFTGARDHDAVGFVLIGEPRHPALAARGQREGGMIAGRVGFREPLLDRQAFDAAVAAEDR